MIGDKEIQGAAAVDKDNRAEIGDHNLTQLAVFTFYQFINY